MNKKNEEDKKSFVQLFLSHAQEDSGGKDAAEEFLRSEGINVERLKSEGLYLIKKKQLELQAKKTELEMAGMGDAGRQAEEWVEKLLRSATFSFTDFVREESVVVAFSHIEKLTAGDIRAILVQHYTLKFMKRNT
jgi:hypothetical protein